MRDPHVEQLHYEIGTGEGLSFGAPAPVDFSNHLGRFHLENGKLLVSPMDHYPNAGAARAIIDPFLRSWEVKADLLHNIGAIRFKFVDSKIVDLNPLPPGSGTTVSTRTGEVIVTGELTSLHITQNSYPAAPTVFRTTPEVELAYGRWRAFREGREPLQSMAYLVLTLCEAISGDRRKAAASLDVEKAVLDTIGQLSSTKGDKSTIRKLKPGAALQPLSGAESSWLDAAVRRLVYRLGEHASGAPLRRIAMTDFPPL